MTLTTEGRFCKVRIKALGMNEYGRYRGRGKLTIDDEGIKIEGRHVKSLRARWGIGILLVIASGVLTGGAIILGFIPVFLLMEYVILSRENLSIPWSKVRKYAFDPYRQLAAIAFDGSEWTSPAVINTSDIALIVQAFREKAPEKEATSNQPEYQLSTLAVFSLVLFPIPIIGLPMAVAAMRKISRSDGHISGRTLAIISLVINSIMLLMWLLVIVMTNLKSI